MKVITTLAVLALGSTVGVASAHELHNHSHVKTKTISITVACYRGPWEQVYWDRAKPEFYDSLTRAGFSPERAQALGDRVCRDQALVNNPEAMRREASRLIATTPRR
ncbi:hypothetical protein C8N43_0679 [Litoreibacter ponti]|uniref:Uncharacterized protein n=1 Tax=Litoreibacter ponti TaxID=1510457 RepID=A0A2T6BIZ2_9RHOB|nr:hypothetical protein [Litoreibacter ponti]PTX56029.1 hypothetical protein C8N43_0679 [Litoreibacter ponti]